MINLYWYSGVLINILFSQQPFKCSSNYWIKIVIEPAYTHKNGTRGIVFIHTIGKDAYDFFDKLDKQKLAQFNPFVEPIF